MEMEEYETVQRWLNGVQSDHSGSQHTIRNYKRWFRKFVEWIEKNPDELVEKRKEELKNDDTAIKRTAEETLRNFCIWLEKEQGYKRGTVRAHHGAIKSFYAYNYVPLMLKAPKKSASFGVGAHTKEEIKKLHDVANLRDRAVVLCLAESGMSRADFCMLTYGDIATDYEKNLETIHLHVIRRKAEIVYDTFIGKSGTVALRNYLEVRKRKGETLTADTPLFPSGRGGNQFESTNSLTLLVWRLAQKVGLISSPHRFRKFFESNLGVRVPTLLVKHWMGHSVGVESSYFLPNVEEQRKAYESAYEQIDVLGVTKKPSEDAVEMYVASIIAQIEDKTEKEQQAIIKGIQKRLSPPLRKAFKTQMAKAKLTKKIDKGLRDVMQVKKKVSPLHMKKKLVKRKKASENDDCQYVIDEKDLEKYLRKGYRFVANLPSGKILVED